MSVEQQQVRITSPCPITLDRSGAQSDDRELFCGHCSKEVHLLSHMSEGEAREFLARRAGDDICVSYAVKPDGTIRFRPEPLIPATTLVRPSALRRGLAMAASIGAAALLSACTPHGEDELVGNVGRVEVRGEVQPDVEPAPPPEEVVAGGLTAEPLPPELPCDPPIGGEDITVEGGLEAAPVELPPAPELRRRKEVHRAGGLRAKPLPPLDQDP